MMTPEQLDRKLELEARQLERAERKHVVKGISGLVTMLLLATVVVLGVMHC